MPPPVDKRALQEHRRAQARARLAEIAAAAKQRKKQRSEDPGSSEPASLAPPTPALPKKSPATTTEVPPVPTPRERPATTQAEDASAPAPPGKEPAPTVATTTTPPESVPADCPPVPTPRERPATTQAEDASARAPPGKEPASVATTTTTPEPGPVVSPPDHDKEEEQAGESDHPGSSTPVKKSPRQPEERRTPTKSYKEPMTPRRRSPRIREQKEKSLALSMATLPKLRPWDVPVEPIAVITIDDTPDTEKTGEDGNSEVTSHVVSEVVHRMALVPESSGNPHFFLARNPTTMTFTSALGKKLFRTDMNS